MPIIEDVSYNLDEEKFQKKIIVHLYRKKSGSSGKKMLRSENSIIRPRRIHNSWGHLNNKTPSSNKVFSTEEFQKENYDKSLALLMETHTNPKRKKKNKMETTKNISKIIFQHFENYCEKTSLHGLRYVGDNSLTLIERIFWVIAFAAALAFASYYIINIFEKWKNNPVIVAFNPVDATFNEIPFPAITICNMNQAKKVEAERILSGSDPKEKQLLNEYCNYNGTFDNTKEAPGWEIVKQFLIRVGQTCSDTVKSCTWQGDNISCDDYFNNDLTDEGLCCSFNKLPPRYIFKNPDDIASLNQSYPKNVYDWSPEKGFLHDNNGDINTIPIRPSGSGTHLGLTLIVDAQVDNYFCSSTRSTGFKIMLSNPIETSKIADFAYLVSPGMEARYVIKPEIKEATPALRYIDVEKRQCFFQDERPLRYFRSYTKRNCNLECQSNHTLNRCHCIPYYLPKSKTVAVCGKRHEECVSKAKEDMELIYGNGSSCHCLPSCYEISFDKSATYSNFTNVYIKHDLENVTDEYFRKNMAVLHFFFRENRFRRQVKSEIFGTTEVLSNVGGLLGLCLGFSVLSFIEIFYYLTLKLVCDYIQSSRKARKKKENIIPFMR